MSPWNISQPKDADQGAAQQGKPHRLSFVSEASFALQGIASILNFAPDMPSMEVSSFPPLFVVASRDAKFVIGKFVSGEWTLAS